MNFARTTRRTKKSGDQRTREAIVRRMTILLDIAASDICVEDDNGKSFCVFCEVDVPEEDHDPERVHLPACVYRRAIREREAARRLVAEVRGNSNEEKFDVRRTG